MTDDREFSTGPWVRIMHDRCREEADGADTDGGDKHCERMRKREEESVYVAKCE